MRFPTSLVVLTVLGLAVAAGAQPTVTRDPSAPALTRVKIAVHPGRLRPGATATFAVQYEVKYEVNTRAGALEVEEFFVVHLVETGQRVKVLHQPPVSRPNGPATTLIDFTVPADWLDGQYTVTVLIKLAGAVTGVPDKTMLDREGQKGSFRVDTRAVPQGVLALRSEVPGVDVWLGSERLGQVGPGRDSVTARPTATYRLRAHKTGHADWEKSVLVAANTRADVLIDIEPLGPAKVVKGADDAEMVLVPAGQFSMGSDDYGDEKPRHRAYLDAFYIDRHEATNALFERFVQATGHRTTAERATGWVWLLKDGNRQAVKAEDVDWRRPSGPGSPAEPSHPVVQVSWHDADAYCRWAGKRLPTEAEWEKAARGTDGRKYPWGENWDASRANSGESSLAKTAAAGSYPSGESPYGAHDMAVNVWEWVADWYDKDYYTRAPERNPTGPANGQTRVLRGGAWLAGRLYLRTAQRYNLWPDDRYNFIGFRCAKGLP